ncbi:DUF4450 domain-containing protein [Edaphobacter sp.]|uniref:DUF4450 domain-containing protein n=1 Tax=Edaphobacter sp. TaxID=1934404 RepID=UPI002DB7ADB4|nr:DUF4450 domain-containing protein [Edaphobacter sp.]HEU5340644.1 DUF4450 domain-containing protein [Edaphobacter sp.]
MSYFPFWTRRRFLAGSTVAAALIAGDPLAFAQRHQSPHSAASSPEEITGKVRGLMKGQTARPMRYLPGNGGFHVQNGSEFFNRPLYGPNNAFRVDAGDLPEFSLYLPGHGGNLRLGIAAEGSAKWLHEAHKIDAVYRAGRMFYEVRDPLLQQGALRVEIMTMAEGSGLYIHVEAAELPAGARLLWAFGGVSGRKGKRGGDIGCEVEPVSLFFQLRPEECKGNAYALHENTSSLHSKAADMMFHFPRGSVLGLGDAARWNAGWEALSRPSAAEITLPVLLGSVEIASGEPLSIALRRETESQSPLNEPFADAIAARALQLDAISTRVSITTPDEYINLAAGALNTAADALWDSAQGCVMHGAVAWRVPLAGWRGPYVLDATGQHDRFRQHARHWIARQNRSPITTSDPATGHPDPGSHLARTENLLHSRGDISHNHYDMNLVFFDTVLRHLQWTRDLDFAKEIWPALMLHLDWERRLFRRTYTVDGANLPLYEAYACIWASDNLQYNGGGAAHSTAYNYYANKWAARIAKLIGEDPAPYEREADLIRQGMSELLWLPEQGTFAESKDILGMQTAYTSPALWTIYHTIDSEVASPSEAQQMVAERLAALRHVPIHGEGVPTEGLYILPCSDWMPYIWSLNLLLLAENMHMALALWQAGRADEAFRIFKGNLIDSMFQGLTPGNFHMTSQLDVHRQEAQRDFGDPIGIASRALIEGLFGIKPNLLDETVTIRPGFPSSWNNAALDHPDIHLKWQRKEQHESFAVISHFAKPVELILHLRAPRTGAVAVKINGSAVHATHLHNSPNAQIEIRASKSSSWNIEVEWSGELIAPQPAIAARVLAHTQQPARTIRSEEHAEPIDLSALLTHRLSDLFTRSYTAPRSPYCSLSIPEQGIGAWAAFDTQPQIDDRGIYRASGILETPLNVPFHVPQDRSAPNCIFLSHWQQDRSSIEIPLSGKASSLYLLLAGTTFPQCSRMTHAVIRAHYIDGSSSTLELRNPENWWPMEQDYLIDDYLFVDEAPCPPRVDLRTGSVRILDPISFRGKGTTVEGGAATIVELALDPDRPLRNLSIEVKLYGIVVGVLSATLVRS